MRLIVGGAYQGKHAYAVQKYGFREEEIGDGAVADLDDIGSFKCIGNFQTLIKRALTDGGNPMEVTEKLLKGNPGVVILMDQVGNGIIPLERSERVWREQVGRCGCFLAAQAESVERVVCGIATRIK